MTGLADSESDSDSADCAWAAAAGGEHSYVHGYSSAGHSNSRATT